MHKDVLDATPEDQPGKEKLVAEIKERAKGAVGGKVYPAADALYSKAIEVLPDASLYGNRSMCRLALGKFQEAFDDAESAIAADPTYSKAFYRKGQAATKLGAADFTKHLAAAEAYDQGSALEPENKVFKSLAEKARKAHVEGEAKAAEEPPPLADKPLKMPIFRPRGFVDPVKKGDASSETAAASSSKDGAKKEEFRGYKVTADGRKTTFFNNDLDDEAKALIGDIAPKKLAADDGDGAAGAQAQSAAMAGASSWNTAGTWEERSHTAWGKERLEELLLEAACELPNGMGLVTVGKVTGLEGDCSVTMARGKKKHPFDWAFTLEWALVLKDAGPCKGTLKYPDVTPDCEGEYETAMEVDRSTPPQARAVLDEFVKRSGAGLQPAVAKQIQKFVDEFNAIE